MSTFVEQLELKKYERQIQLEREIKRKVQEAKFDQEIASHGYRPTRLTYVHSPGQSSIKRLYVKHDHNGYHYRLYGYQTRDTLTWQQFKKNLIRPLQKGDRLGGESYIH